MKNWMMMILVFVSVGARAETIFWDDGKLIQKGEFKSPDSFIGETDNVEYSILRSDSQFYYPSLSQNIFPSGQEFYYRNNKTGQYATAKVLGMNHQNQFAVELTEDAQKGQRISQVTKEQLASLTACIDKIYCPNKKFYFYQKVLYAKTILAVGQDGSIWFKDYYNQIHVSNGLEDFKSEIFDTVNCHTSPYICPGTEYFLASSNSIVEILGQIRGLILYEFKSGVKKGSVETLAPSDSAIWPLQKSCREDLCVGEKYLDMSHEFAEVQILAFGPENNILIDLGNDHSKVAKTDARYLVREKKSCAVGTSWCVDQKIFLKKPYNFREGKIVGVQRDNRLTIKIADSEDQFDIDPANLALTAGCEPQKKFCVGGTYFTNTEKGYLKIKLMGLNIDGTFEAKIQKRDDDESKLSNLNPNQLKLSGCQNKICREKDL